MREHRRQPCVTPSKAGRRTRHAPSLGTSFRARPSRARRSVMARSSLSFAAAFYSDVRTNSPSLRCGAHLLRAGLTLGLALCLAHLSRPAGRQRWHAQGVARQRPLASALPRIFRERGRAMPSVWWLIAGAIVALYVRISRIRALPCTRRDTDRVHRAHRAPHGPPVGTPPLLLQFPLLDHSTLVP